MSRRNNYTTKAARAAGYRSGFEEKMSNELHAFELDYVYEDPEACTFKYNTKVTQGHCTDCSSNSVLQARIYTCDFCIVTPNGPSMFIETKGRFTASDRSKMEAVTKQHPEADIRILFQYNGKATPKRSYLEWCEWKGIKAAVIKNKRGGQFMPEGWLEELGCSK